MVAVGFVDNLVWPVYKRCYSKITLRTELSRPVRRPWARQEGLDNNLTLFALGHCPVLFLFLVIRTAAQSLFLLDMNADEPQNLTELEDKAIDEIARFLVLAARSIYQREKETGENLLAAIIKQNEQSNAK